MIFCFVLFFSFHFRFSFGFGFDDLMSEGLDALYWG